VRYTEALKSSHGVVFLGCDSSLDISLLGCGSFKHAKYLTLISNIHFKYLGYGWYHQGQGPVYGQDLYTKKSTCSAGYFEYHQLISEHVASSWP